MIPAGRRERIRNASGAPHVERERRAHPPRQASRLASWQRPDLKGSSRTITVSPLKWSYAVMRHGEDSSKRRSTSDGSRFADRQRAYHGGAPVGWRARPLRADGSHSLERERPGPAAVLGQILVDIALTLVVHLN